jgi:DNA-binding ferritin-like protein
MIAPKVANFIAADDQRENLQQALNFIAEVATTLGETPMAEFFNNPTIRAFAGHFIGIEQKLANLAADPIPF